MLQQSATVFPKYSIIPTGHQLYPMSFYMVPLNTSWQVL